MKSGKSMMRSAAPSIVSFILAASVLVGCDPQSGPEINGAAPENVGQPRFLALGDSYTIGEGVEPGRPWPVQLASLLRARGISIADPLIVARTGWTCDELIAGLDAARPRGTFSLVTLMIGVNDQFRGRQPDDYRRSFQTALRGAIQFAGGEPKRVVVISIPDWGVTPYGEGSGRPAIGEQIDRFNVINREEAERAGARFVDVTEISRAEGAKPEMLVADGLHPAAPMYELWAAIALPEALSALQ
jgi:lysophospholipase L1-like esterase